MWDLKKTKSLVHISIYYTIMNSDIEKYIKNALHVLNFSKCSQRNK